MGTGKRLTDTTRRKIYESWLEAGATKTEACYRTVAEKFGVHHATVNRTILKIERSTDAIRNRRARQEAGVGEAAPHTSFPTKRELAAETRVADLEEELAETAASFKAAMEELDELRRANQVWRDAHSNLTAQAEALGRSLELANASANGAEHMIAGLRIDLSVAQCRAAHAEGYAQALLDAAHPPAPRFRPLQP